MNRYAQHSNITNLELSNKLHIIKRKMNDIIFEFRFLRKILLTPAGNGIDMYSPDMETDLGGMDVDMFRAKINSIPLYRGCSKAKLVGWCIGKNREVLFREDLDVQAYQNISEELKTLMMETMSLLLSQQNSLSDPLLKAFKQNYIEFILQLIVLLLTSNQNSECKAWIRERSSELKSFRAAGESILHLAMNIRISCFSRVPILSVLIDVVKMDVNVENDRRETPLHLLSHKVSNLLIWGKQPTQDMLDIADLLVDRGAHMDAKHRLGLEASYSLSQTYPKYAFNVNLQCLAAKVILKHGISYEKETVPADVQKFIKSHKAGTL